MREVSGRRQESGLRMLLGQETHLLAQLYNVFPELIKGHEMLFAK